MATKYTNPPFQVSRDARLGQSCTTYQDDYGRRKRIDAPAGRRGCETETARETKANTRANANAAQAPRTKQCFPKNHLSEVKSMMNPPQMVKTAMEALFTLLGESDRDAKNWVFVKKQLVENKVYERCVTFDPATLSPEVRRKVKATTVGMSVEKMACISSAMARIYQWVLSVVG